MIFALILLPFLAGIVSFFIYSNSWRRKFLVSVASLEMLMVIQVWIKRPEPYKDLLLIDPLGLLVLTVTCILFLAASFYAYGYLRKEEKDELIEEKKGIKTSYNQPEAVFTACLLIFFACAVLVTMAQHFGLLWVAIEATTLATAPLIYYHKTQRSLEATWKYLIICSVGIALALLGNFLLDVSWQTDPTSTLPLTLSAMVKNAAGVDELWFKIAFIFIFIGYGTKMGLAPMHTWLPDAHSEAPSIASALLSGALLNCAFLGILRLYRLSVAAGYQDFSHELFIIFGLLSMLVAAFFIIGQTDFKRMLAYSSVEHMGILLLGIGVSGYATYGSMMHLVAHSFTKAAMFLLAGNILSVYGVQTIHQITGCAKIMPKTGPLWMAGFLALVGSPPFGLFTSEFTILRGMLADGFGIVPLIYLLCLALIFVGMASTCLYMTYGKATEGMKVQKEEHSATIPSMVLLAGSLMIGLYQPMWLRKALMAASQCITGGPSF